MMFAKHDDDEEEKEEGGGEDVEVDEDDLDDLIGFGGDEETE